MNDVTIGIDKVIVGHQVWFQIGNQRFYLYEIDRSVEPKTKKYAKFYRDMLKIAFQNLGATVEIK